MEAVARIFKDPISGLTHLAGTLLGVVGLIYLLGISAEKETSVTTAVSIYGVSLVLLYAASSTYHLLHVSDVARARLRQVDHAIIPVFIAGTYTPFCLIALNGWYGTVILCVVWALAVGGFVKSLYWIHAPRWVTAGLFVLMGWLIVVAAVPLSKAISIEAFVYVAAGGIAYTLGAVIYSKKRPDPWPGVFGFHEIWHLFVMAGSTLHYLGVLALLNGVV